MRKRNNAVYVRFDDQEYEELLRRVDESGLTIQSYIINSALGAVITTKEDREILCDLTDTFKDMNRQLRGLGTNINQMSRHANRSGAFPALRELEEIKEYVSGICKEVNQAWQLIRRLISAQ